MSAVFQFTARSAEGRVVGGRLHAPDESSALGRLRADGLYVTWIDSDDSPGGSIVSALRGEGRGRGQLLWLYRGFSTLVSAGVGIGDALDSIERQCGRGPMQQMIAGVLRAVREGSTLHEALAAYPAYFPPAAVAMIHAGEVSGRLETVLDRLAESAERDGRLHKRLAASLAYPAVVASAACLLTIFLLTGAVPMFAALYAQQHVALPPITSAMLGASAFCRSEFAPLCGAALCAAIPAIARWKRLKRKMIDVLLRVPFAGSFVRKSTCAHFAGMLGSMLASGVSIVQALSICGAAIEIGAYGSRIVDLRKAIDAGSAIAPALAGGTLFEPLFVRMVRIGEETGTLDRMLLRVASYYEEDVESMLTALTAIVEPAMILLLGGVVAFIVAAIFIPLYSLIGNIR